MSDVYALPCSPEVARKPTMHAWVANFGIGASPRAAYDRSSPTSVLGRVVCGFREDLDLPWVTFEPKEVPAIRADVLHAIEISDRERSHDEYAEWFGDQLRAVDRVLAHAARRGEWVVSIFEGSTACFLRGGRPRFEPTDSMFQPHCAPASLSRPPSRIVPLGLAGVLCVGLALAGWRQRRFLKRLSGV